VIKKQNNIFINTLCFQQERNTLFSNSPKDHHKPLHLWYLTSPEKLIDHFLLRFFFAITVLECKQKRIDYDDDNDD